MLDILVLVGVVWDLVLFFENVELSTDEDLGDLVRNDLKFVENMQFVAVLGQLYLRNAFIDGVF